MHRAGDWEAFPPLAVPPWLASHSTGFCRKAYCAFHGPPLVLGVVGYMYRGLGPSPLMPLAPRLHLMPPSLRQPEDHEHSLQAPQTPMRPHAQPHTPSTALTHANPPAVQVGDPVRPQRWSEVCAVAELVHLKLLMLGVHQGRLEDAVAQVREHLAHFGRPAGALVGAGGLT